MSKYVVVAALLALAACGEKQAPPAVDSAAVAAPAPAPADTSMAMPDSAMAGDTTHKM
jgi:predicted small lipoprotein YifL